MEKLEALKQIIASVEEDFTKLYMKNIKVSATRIRKAMQEIKTIAQEVRKEVQEYKESI